MRPFTIAAVGALLLVLGLLAPGTSGQPTAPPRHGRILTVPAQGDLQGAIDRAAAGDTIALQAGTTYRGSFRLPWKTGSATGWIVITTDSRLLPAAGTRVHPDQASLMARLESEEGPVISADPGAHHYRFVGIEIAPAPGTFLTNVVLLGNEERSLDRLPGPFEFARCYIHGDPARGSRRGIALNARDSSVVDSYFADFKEVGADSQAIAGWNGPGPYRLVNNYFEAAGENLMFGGADPALPDLVPSDIEIRNNHFSKPRHWHEGSPEFAGTTWTVKNLLELKNARRVVIDGNLFERSWRQAQNGFAILFTPKNQDGQSPWVVVEDVEFTNNVVRDALGGINVLGRDDPRPSGRARRLTIRNNLFVEIGERLFQLLHGTDEVTIDHNTAIDTGTLLTGGDDLPHTDLVFTNNVVPNGEYGIKGSGTASGHATLRQYFPGATVRGNVIIGGDPATLPADNFFPRSLDQVGFVDVRGGNYRLSGTSPYRAAAEGGRPAGADFDALQPAFAAVSSRSARSDRVQAASAFPRAAVESMPVVLQSPVLLRAAAVTFWGALFLVVYTYVGYGAVVLLVAHVRPRPVRRACIHPSVTIIVVAYNEGTRIARKIENLLQLDYPSDRLEIIVASDGSTDDTAEIAAAHEPRIRTIAFPSRRGKPAVLNEVVLLASGEIVVLADARQMFDKPAVSALVEPFADPSVGAVSGALVLLRDGQSEPAGDGAAMYWELEKIIRLHESRFHSTIGATGAIYAIRRDLFERLPVDTVLDDVLLPLRMVRRGYRILFEPRARAFDRRTATGREEFARKVRTIGGTFQLFDTERWTLSPFHNPVWLQMMSHKGLRLTLPLLYLAILFSNAALLGHRFYQLAMAGQLAFYSAALLALILPTAKARAKILVVPYTVCFLSWATIVGFSRYLTGQLQVTWDRSGVDRRQQPRPGSAERRRIDLMLTESPKSAPDLGIERAGAEASARTAPIRVLLIAPSMAIVGGQAIQAQRLLRDVPRVGGIDLHFLPVNPRLPGSLHHLQRIKYVRTVVTSAVYWVMLLRTVRQYEVLHIFSAAYWSFLLAPTPALIAGKLYGKRTILNYRSGEAEDHIARSLVARHVARAFDTIVVPSGFLVGVFARFGLPAREIPCIVDFEHVRYRPRERVRPSFLSNRNFEPLYNVACTLRAYALIARQYPDARLDLVGDGSERRRLEALCRELALPNVTFHGQVSTSRMWELYDRADIFLNSPNIDNMPVSILEAQACGVPVVTTDAGGIPFIVEDGVTGLLVRCGDAAGLAASACRYLTDPALVVKVTEAGRRATCAYHSEAVIAAWLGTYSDLIPEARRGCSSN
jgi:glycosyltransferase involved in cell wall biosynthesis/cellulose synthase/poly-beta-1,6-N-acetylglucosamine synthase-like glycosyltransferase